jgi:outer membrane protein assembly factor BamB
MMKRHAYRGILVLAVILSGSAFAWWLSHDPVEHFSLSLPGMDKRGSGTVIPEAVVKIGDSFTMFRAAEDVPGTRWPRFRGSDFDNINKEKIPLIDHWDPAGPKILWKVYLGDGHAAPAVFDGKVYLLDYIESGKSDALRCFSLQTGEELWRRWYHVRLKRNHGMSRTIPAVNEKYIITIGPKAQVMCVDRKTGNFLWGFDIPRECHSEVPFWYTGQCPLIDNDTAIIATGGASLMIGIECKTGKKVWETPNPRQWKMSHASIISMTYHGKKMYIYIAIGGFCGVSASGADRGKILWESTGFAPAVVAPSAVIMDEGRIFFTAGYGAGSALVQLKESGGRYSVMVLQKFKPSEGLASEQQTPVFFDGFLYGILPKDAGNDRNQFVCCKEDDVMKFVMKSGKTERFGLGPYIYADGKFFILNDEGEMTIAKATPSSFRILDRKRIIDGQDSWGPLAVTGGYLLMRDSKQMVCIDLKK